ncbi:hypothetical protein PEC301296_39180 [Pectobacterium carotovorum subsp. carotovorum]|nr:hypothetical protein PB72LOC_02979 [Pectobacterium atrosepticum]GKV87607.1 hypothetical protein PEC301296_39180 [Pectobacterium carotovorum subsp. carotovorum]
MSIIFDAHILRVTTPLRCLFSCRILDKKKPSIMEGEKTGMVSMARKNRVCTYYTLLLGLHYVTTYYTRTTTRDYLSQYGLSFLMTAQPSG